MIDGRRDGRPPHGLIKCFRLFTNTLIQIKLAYLQQNYAKMFKAILFQLAILILAASIFYVLVKQYIGNFFASTINLLTKIIFWYTDLF